MPIKAGDTLPDVTLFEGGMDSAAPVAPVKLRELFAGKKGVLISVPGAYTPTCSKTHIPGFVAAHDKFVAAGADVIACFAVNDPFVMEAWGQSCGADGKVRMLSDMNLEATKAMDVGYEILSSTRSKRFSLVIVDNIVRFANLEAGGELTCSASDPVLEQLSQV